MDQLQLAGARLGMLCIGLSHERPAGCRTTWLSSERKAAYRYMVHPQATEMLHPE